MSPLGAEAFELGVASRGDAAVAATLSFRLFFGVSTAPIFVTFFKRFTSFGQCDMLALTCGYINEFRKYIRVVGRESLTVDLC